MGTMNSRKAVYIFTYIIIVGATMLSTLAGYAIAALAGKDITYWLFVILFGLVGLNFWYNTAMDAAEEVIEENDY